MAEKNKTVYLIFSADSTYEGTSLILDVLKKRNLKGSFFLTGNFLREKERKSIIERIINENHYVGCHSDRHILYASWGTPSVSLVTTDSVKNDYMRNVAEFAKYGISSNQMRYFLPPYEWCKSEHREAIESFGVEVVNFTPGITVSADYTTPIMRNYKSSQELIDELYDFERTKGLSGAIILVHPGTDALREDKLYNRLDEIISYLLDLGYSFDRLP